MSHFSSLKDFSSIEHHCPNLETLAIVGSRGFNWARTDCQVQISDAIANGAGPRLRTLRLWDMAICIRSFRRFLEPLTHLGSLRKIEMNFHETPTFFTRDREVEDYQKCPEKDHDAESPYANTTRDLQRYLSEIKAIVEQGRWTNQANRSSHESRPQSSKLVFSAQRPWSRASTVHTGSPGLKPGFRMGRIGQSKLLLSPIRYSSSRKVFRRTRERAEQSPTSLLNSPPHAYPRQDSSFGGQ